VISCEAQVAARASWCAVALGQDLLMLALALFSAAFKGGELTASSFAEGIRQD
jgi:hypothetical protein